MVGGDALTELPMARAIARELEICGSHGMAARDYPAMLAEIAAGALTPQRLIAGRIGLAELPEALVRMGSRPTPGTLVVHP
jgi:alcohol dehydrogenase